MIYYNIKKISKIKYFYNKQNFYYYLIILFSFISIFIIIFFIFKTFYNFCKY